MRPFFLRIYRKGKRNNNHNERNPRTSHKERGQAEDKRISKESRKRDKSRSKKEKTEANTPQTLYPPNSTRVQKPHKPRKDLNPYKYTSAPQNPLKTPLKSQIKPYLQSTHHKQSRRADKRQGERDGTHTAGHRKPLHHLHHLHPVDTTTATTKEDESSTTEAPKVKYIFVFAVFGLPNSRENTKHPQKIIYFCPFLLKICPDRLKIDNRRG